MQMLLIFGAIAVVIFYILRMRANQKTEDDESTGTGQQGFMKDVFSPPDNTNNIDSGGNSNSAADEDEDEGEEGDDGAGAPQIGDPYNDLEKLAALFEKGILTKEEYEAKKKELLDRI